jgi:hypothetical protein
VQGEESSIGVQTGFDAPPAEVTLVQVIAYRQEFGGEQLVPREILNLFLS